MNTQIVIEFECDPKKASPLEVINTLDSEMLSNLEEGRITDYTLSAVHENIVEPQIILVPTKTPQTPKENPA